MRVRLAFEATRWPWSGGRARATWPLAAWRPRVAHRQSANHKRSPAPKTTRADYPAWPFAPARATARPGQPFPVANREAAAAGAPPASLQSHRGMAAPTRFPHSRETADESAYSRSELMPPNSNHLPQLMNLTDRDCHWASLQQKMVPCPSGFHPLAGDKQRSGRRPTLRADPAWPPSTETPSYFLKPKFVVHREATAEARPPRLHCSALCHPKT